MNDISPPKSLPHTCITCGCYFVQTHPLKPGHSQGFCRLNPPAYGQVEVNEVVLNPITKEPRTDKDGKPRMQMVRQDVYMYPPTMPELTCFSGWRPAGTEPGVKWNPALDLMEQQFKTLFLDVIAEIKPPHGLDG